MMESNISSFVIVVHIFFILILIRAVDNISNDEPLRDGKKFVLSGGYYLFLFLFL